MIYLLLPYPPTINHYYGVRGKSRFIKADGLNFRKIVAAVQPQGTKPMLGNISVLIYISPPDKRKRDIDNVLKALLDALTHAGVWADDSQIVDLHIIKCDPIKGGETKITISELSNHELTNRA